MIVDRNLISKGIIAGNECTNILKSILQKDRIRIRAFEITPYFIDRHIDK